VPGDLVVEGLAWNRQLGESRAHIAFGSAQRIADETCLEAFDTLRQAFDHAPIAVPGVGHLQHHAVGEIAQLTYALDAQNNPNYDGVMLTSGVLAGGTRAYGFRADLRAVYQY